MNDSTLALKMDLLQKVMNIDSEVVLKKLLKLIEKERKLDIPEEQHAYMVSRVLKAQDDIANGRVYSHEEALRLINEHIAARKDGTRMDA